MNRRVRLPNGKWITRKLAESPPQLLATAKPEEIWTTGEGCRIRIRDMEASHLVNCLRIMMQQTYSKMVMLNMADGQMPCFDSLAQIKDKRFGEIVAFAERTIPKFKVMRDELDIKLGRKQREPEKPEPVPEATARKFDFSL